MSSENIFMESNKDKISRIIEMFCYDITVFQMSFQNIDPWGYLRCMSIQVKNLLKIYGGQKAVNQISFSIKKGEIVGFLGPNGAGKSTTMKIITGYLKQTDGDACVCDISVSSDPLRVKKKIGYLPEQNALYYDMYVKEYLDFIADLHSINSRREQVNKVINTTGLTKEAHKRIGQLSKGYKQRVGLAAALIHDPEVLILDEPTSGLDPNQIIEIREVIRQQGKDKTVLLSSHILQEVEAICDRVIIIDKGILVADDKLDNLKKGNKTSQAVIVKFDKPADHRLFENMKDVTALEYPSPDSIRLITETPEPVKKQILERSLQHNLNIVSLQSESQSLEDVFRSLTQKAGQ